VEHYTSLANWDVDMTAGERFTVLASAAVAVQAQKPRLCYFYYVISGVLHETLRPVDPEIQEDGEEPADHVVRVAQAGEVTGIGHTDAKGPFTAHPPRIQMGASRYWRMRSPGV
jgi:ribonuclease PH